MTQPRRLPSLPSLPPAGLVVEGESAIVAREGRCRTVPLAELAALAAADPARWVWWSAAGTVGPLVAAGVHLDACWDLGVVHRLLHGRPLDDPTVGDDDQSLFGRERPPGEELALRALDTQRTQAAALVVPPDPRASPTGTHLAVLTAHAESAAALLAVELGHHGLPLSVPVATEHLRATIGERGADPARREAEVLRHFRDDPVDLRNPAAVKDLLLRHRIDVPDTRSWRLGAYVDHPGVAALLHWRRVERIATTYGWSWLDHHVTGGRLRGQWLASDGAAGRMTASAGLHNLPAELRGCVVADRGHVLVRADLGQIEPRVLAVVSGDAGLREATLADDMYTPVAAALGVDRPTAKIAVLAAMYGQTSGAAGEALKRMEVAYPAAMAHLRAAAQRGLVGLDVRTWGGRTVRMGGDGSTLPPDQGRGRYARNAVVQGAAAELFKAWAATVRAGLPSYDARIVLCLHDELLVHAPVGSADAVTELLHSSLASAAGWWAAGSGVRFVAVATRGESWADAKD